MINVVKHKLFDDIPKELTVSAISKHFKDNCLSCSKATMSQKSLPKVSNRVYKVGECCSLDIKEWTVSDFSGHKDSLHAIDLGSGHSETFLSTDHSNLIDYVKIIHDNWLRDGHFMEEMRVDDAFVTAEFTEYLAKQHIKRTQPTPYEHDQNGNV